MREMDVFVDTDEIAEFFYQELLRRGFVPREEDVAEIADITFEYLLAKHMIDEDVDT